MSSYLIMPDRFADGDPSNNAPADVPATANDRQNPRAFHGGDLRGIINHLGYLKDLGVTALWLNPWYDNWNGVNNCDRPWCQALTITATTRSIITRSRRSLWRYADAARVDRESSRAGSEGNSGPGGESCWLCDIPGSPIRRSLTGFTARSPHHDRNRFQNSSLLSPHANGDEYFEHAERLV